MSNEIHSLPRFSSWSTQDAPQTDAIDRWREIRRRAYVTATVDPVDRASERTFRGEVRVGRYADFTLTTKRASAEDVRRDRSTIAQGGEDDEYLYLVFQIRGSCVVEQAGRAAVVPPGSLVIYESASPFALRTDGPYEQVIVEVPAEQAFALAGLDRSRAMVATQFDCSGAMASVAAFFISLAHNQDSDPLAAHRLGSHALALAASLLSLAAPARPHLEVPAVVRRDQVLSYMRAHLTDPELDADRIAAGVHVSRRTLYRTFQGTGESVMGSLRSLRLESAQHLLRTHPDMPVSMIARRLGFPNPTQFYRSFRATVDMTPGEYRELATPAV